MKKRFLGFLLSLVILCSGCAHSTELQPETADEGVVESTVETAAEATAETTAEQQEEAPVDGEGTDPVLLRAGEVASATIARSVKEMVYNSWHNAILLVQFVNPGEYTKVESSQTFVSEGLEDVTISSCGIEALATVVDVYKGDEELIGQTITIGEALNQDENGEFADGLLSKAEMHRAIILANKQESTYQYVCNTPEHEIVPVADDDSITVWPWLSEAPVMKTVEDFAIYCRGLVEEEDIQPILVDGVYVNQRKELTEEEMRAVETALNKPLNNYLVRLSYTSTGINTVSANRNEALAGGAGREVTEATEEEIAAYVEATGVQPEALIRMDREVFEHFQGWNLGLGDCELATNWTYLEEYDAWFSQDVECKIREITVLFAEQELKSNGRGAFHITYQFQDEEGLTYIGKLEAAPSGWGDDMDGPMEEWAFTARSNVWELKESTDE